MITHIIFDNNGVLTSSDDERTYKRVSEFLGISIEEFKLLLNKFVKELDEGKLSQEDFYYRILEEGKFNFDASEFSKIHLESYIPKNEVQDFAIELKKRYNISLLSNFGDAFWDQYKKWGLHKLFEVKNVFVSSDLGKAKPDKEIFLEVLERLKIKSEKAVFIDDNLDNIKTASGLGFNAIHFKNLEQVKNELMELGIKF